MGFLWILCFVLINQSTFLLGNKPVLYQTFCLNLELTGFKDSLKSDTVNLAKTTKSPKPSTPKTVSEKTLVTEKLKSNEPSTENNVRTPTFHKNPKMSASVDLVTTIKPTTKSKTKHLVLESKPPKPNSEKSVPEKSPRTEKHKSSEHSYVNNNRRRTNTHGCGYEL